MCFLLSSKLPLLLFFILLCCHLFVGADPSLVSQHENTSTDKLISATESGAEEFIPTHEWQVVKDGQAIPPGLYVRMNLETGQKQARLLHDNEKTGRQLSANSKTASATMSASAVSIVSKSDEEVVELDENSARSDVREGAALHMFSKLYSGHDDPAGSGVHPSGSTLPEGDSTILDLNNVFDLMSSSASDSSHTQQLPAPNARYSDPQVVAESRERMRELSSLLKPTDDIDTIRQLLTFILSPDASYEDVLLALDSLELLVHQVDNANDWVKVGGMHIVSSLIEPAADALEDEDEALIPSDQFAVDRRVKTHRLLNLQSAACRVLGSAAQNNPEVGAAAIQSGLVRGLLQVLNQSSSDIARDYRKLIAATQLSSEVHSSLSKEEAVVSSSISLHQLRVARFQLQSRAFYALSAIIRHSESAQLLFLQHSGQVLLKHFLLPEFSTIHLLKAIPICSSLSLSPAAVPLCISEQQLKDELEAQAVVNHKAAAMLYDLISDGIINSKISEKSSALSLFHALTHQEVCSLLPSFALHAVNISFSLPSPLPSPFSVSLLLEPNFTSLSAREQILRLLFLLMESGECTEMWQGGGVRENVEKIYWQQKWMWETQKMLEKQEKEKRNEIEKGVVEETSQATEYLLSSYYGELAEIADRVNKFVQKEFIETQRPTEL